jgi:hypothetical protein
VPCTPSLGGLWDDSLRPRPAGRGYVYRIVSLGELYLMAAKI